MDEEAASMRFYRNAIILAAVFAALLVTYIYLPKHSEEQDADKNIKIKTFNRESIAEVNLKNQQGIILLTKTENTWKMSKPQNYKLDKASTESFIDNISDFKAESIIEEKAQDIDKYGLKKPKAELTVKTLNGESTLFLIGDEVPIEGGYYLKTSDKEIIYRIDAYLAGDFLRSASEFRDKTVLELKPDDIAELVLLKQGVEILRFKKINNEWIVKIAEDEKKGDKTEIVNVVGKLASLKAKEFIQVKSSNDLSKYQLDKPIYEISIVFKDRTKKKLFIGKQEDTIVYVQEGFSGEVFTIDKTEVGFIDKDFKAFTKK